MQLHDNPMPEKSAELLQIWDAIFQDKDHHVIVAEKDGKIVSSCVCIIVPNLTHNQQPYAFVENVILNDGAVKEAIPNAKRRHQSLPVRSGTCLTAWRSCVP